MTIQQKRDLLSRFYGPSWGEKVRKMSDRQVAAVYEKFLSDGRIKTDEDGKPTGVLDQTIEAEEKPNKFTKRFAQESAIVLLEIAEQTSRSLLGRQVDVSDMIAAAQVWATLAISLPDEETKKES